MIVLDASAVIELLLRTAAGNAIAARISSPEVSLHAPHLLDVEVAQVLRRYVLAGDMSAERGTQAALVLCRLDIARYSHDLLLARIWELRASLTAYDAAYIALAEVLDAPLLTADGRLGRAHGHRARIELVRGG